MASPISTSLLENFSVVFTFLLIFALSYGALEVSKVFKDKKNIQATIAIAITFIAIINSSFVRIVNMILPWAALILVFFFFLFFILQFMGVGQADILKAMGGDNFNGRQVFWWVFAALIFLLIWALGSSMGQDYLEDGTGVNGSVKVSEVGNELADNYDDTATDSWGNNIGGIIFNKHVLGLFFLILIGVFAIANLTRDW
jgi:hypothetical protein